MCEKNIFKRMLSLCLILALTSSFLGCGTKEYEEKTAKENVIGSFSEVTENVAEALKDEKVDVYVSNDSDIETKDIKAPVPYVEEIPSGNFQIQCSFPDRLDYVDDTLFVNNSVSFKNYEGQGKVYFKTEADFESFSLYINNVLIDTSDVKANSSYCIDISDIANNGNNVIRALDLKPFSTAKLVDFYVPYPQVIKGSLSEAGLSEESFKVIEQIIQSDIEYGFTAASLAVIKNGKLVYSNAFGNTNSYDKEGKPVSDSPKVTTDTLFDLASNTKMYSVNFCIQYLVSEGKLNINDKICDIFGSDFYENTIEINYANYSNPGLETNKNWKKKLTIENLLHHDAGFPADPKYECEKVDARTQKLSNVSNVLYSGNDSSTETRQKTLEAIFKTPLMYEPGSETVYSDVDYMLLGFIIEKITGKRLDDYLKEIFTDPMGLNKITFNPLENGFSKEDCAATEIRGNTREGNVSFGNIRKDTVWGQVHDEKSFYAMQGVSGHAGLFANAEDLAVLANTMLTGGYGTNKFFDRDVIDLFTSPKSEEYSQWALGWWREADDKRSWYFSQESSCDTFGHQGWTGTLTAIDPENDLVIVYLTNKVNSPLEDSSKNLNRFSAGNFTAASLGFVSQLIYMGMDTEGADINQVFDDALISAYTDSLKLANKYGKTYIKSMYSKINVLTKRAMERNDFAFTENVLSCIDLMSDSRDAEVKSEMKNRLPG